MKTGHENYIIHGCESFNKIISFNHVIFKHMQARRDNMLG